MTRTVEKRIPAKIANYPILARISHGGQGTVYKGSDPYTGDAVAIKVLSDQMANDPVLRMRFAQECQVTRRLRHPNIVRVLDFGLDGSKPYLVMEYIEGETLGQIIDREGPLAESRAVAVIAQVGKGLQWAHERGLIHRDVTPDNILVTAEDDAKLTDLGLMKNLDGDFNLTRTQSSFGTPNFIAPEQFEDAKRADALSDLYALGATLHMALTGELPFRAKSNFAIGAIYKKKLSNAYEPPRQLNPEVCERVSAAVCRALRADRAERYASVREMLEALIEPAPVAVSVSICARESERGQSESSKPSPKESEAAGRERRRKTRVATHVGAACRPFDRCSSMVWRGSLVDISETGLCLRLNRKFEPGTNIMISVGGEKLHLRSLVARVMWVEKCSPRAWRIGCQYDQPLSSQEVRDLS
jgi:serine/threonine protein kinase